MSDAFLHSSALSFFSGMITISEFEKHFNDDAVRAFFESLEMGAADAWTLFVALDADGDNVISLRLGREVWGRKKRGRRGRRKAARRVLFWVLRYAPKGRGQ